MMEDTEDFDLKNFEVKNIPASAYYVAEFISAGEECALMQSVYAAPRPKWTQLAHRRLQNWGGLPTARGMLAERLPDWLQHIVSRVASATRGLMPAPNHVLVNEYEPGQGILPHSDGGLFYPVIATVSTGSHTVLRFSTPRSEEARVSAGSTSGAGGRDACALLLEARSLVVLAARLYDAHLHRIDACAWDTTHAPDAPNQLANLPLCTRPYGAGERLMRQTRLSFTIRHVPKTTAFKLNIGNKR